MRKVKYILIILWEAMPTHTIGFTSYRKACKYKAEYRRAHDNDKIEFNILPLEIEVK